MDVQSRTPEELKARAEEIKYLGTHYAMSGVTPPAELEAEYAQIQQALKAASLSR